MGKFWHFLWNFGHFWDFFNRNRKSIFLAILKVLPYMDLTKKPKMYFFFEQFVANPIWQPSNLWQYGKPGGPCLTTGFLCNIHVWWIVQTLDICCVPSSIHNSSHTSFTFVFAKSQVMMLLKKVKTLWDDHENQYGQ